MDLLQLISQIGLHPFWSFHPIVLALMPLLVHCFITPVGHFVYYFDT